MYAVTGLYEIFCSGVSILLNTVLILKKYIEIALLEPFKVQNIKKKICYFMRPPVNLYWHIAPGVAYPVLHIFIILSCANTSCRTF